MVPPSAPTPDSGPERARLDTTAVLLHHARNGDEQARERLFARFLPILTSWAHRRLPLRARDLAETDDLVQVTLLRTLDRLVEFEPRREGAFLAYLRTILLNAVREEIRRSSRRGRSEELTDAISDPRLSVVEEAIGREKMGRYEQALSGLAAEAREAVLLRIEFGYSYQQLAEALGKPTANAARMTVVRAIQQLAEAIDERA